MMNTLTNKLSWRLIKIVGLMFISVILTACSVMPETIQSETVNQINLQSVQQSTNSYKGKSVRWGGVITQVINHEDETWIELLSLELNSRGRPTGDRKNSQGRFIAKVDQFLDPEIYREGQSLTIIGVLADKIDGKIGEFNYSFPVIAAQGHHLWKNISYRRYPYITPGYWYYGFHPFWQYGYGYYGFGVRYNLGYYPYYPIYGHLDRRMEPLATSRQSGTFIPASHVLWPNQSNHLTYALRNRDSRHLREIEFYDGRREIPRTIRTTNTTSRQTRAKPSRQVTTNPRTIPRKRTSSKITYKKQ